MIDTAGPGSPSRRAVLAAAGAAPVLRASAASAATSARLPFDPPGALPWRARAYAYNLGLGSPYGMGLTGTYPLTKNTVTSGDGTYLVGGCVKVLVGGVVVPQPTSTCWWLMPQLQSYRVDRDPRRLAVISATVDHMYSLARTDQVAGRTRTLFPHTLAYHGDRVELGLPWYSAMSQGMTLSAFVQLYEATRDRRWSTIAQQIFASFRHYRNVAANNAAPWFVGYEKAADGWYDTFFEEYPSTKGAKDAHVVNGFIYAIWGVFDYYRLTRDPEAKVLLDRSLATLAHSFGRYRVAAGPSWYAMTPCGRTEWGRPASYHRGVAVCLERTGVIAHDWLLNTQGAILLHDSGSNNPVRRHRPPTAAPSTGTRTS